MILFGSNNRVEQKIEEKIWCIEKRDVYLCVLCSKLIQLYQTFHNPMDSNPPGSSVHGIFQARILE